MPGEPGNAAIAGHRTTYGAPFFRLGELSVRDRIHITTRHGEFSYEVTGSQVVKPSQSEVLAPTDDNRLTLTTCNPKYSAAQRLIITARLLDPPVEPAVTGPPAPEQHEPLASEDVSGTSVSKGPVVAWGALAAGVWAVTVMLARQWGRLTAYATGMPVFLVVLFIFFESVARLLPANM